MYSFDPVVFRERARRFERLDVSSLTLDELYRELMFVISPSSKRPSESHETGILVRVQNFPAGTVFWRARSIPADDSRMAPHSIRTASDVWEAPAQHVTAPGRLNRTNESLLYTCLAEPVAAPLEIRVKPGERFALAKFAATQQVQLACVGLPFPKVGPSVDDASQQINEFMGRQFTRVASDRAGDAYHLSDMVAKYNYDLPPEVQDGWLYPSAQIPDALNATFKLEPAHAKLELQDVAICFLDQPSGRIHPMSTAVKSGDSTIFEWASREDES